MNRHARRKMAKRMILVGLLVVGFLGLIGGRAPVSALTYQQDIGVNFTFNSTLQLTLSSERLIISDLIPGTSADSNVITVNVVTNSVGGYTLNATVGNSTTYNTRNLIHKNPNQTVNFASVAYGSSIADTGSLADDTWAYAYSTDAGSTWANYSGLPLYSDTTNIATLKSSNGPAETTSGDNVEFKIAAKASSSQLAGDYNNVINFALVATPVPTTLFMAYADAGKTQLNGYYKMQDMSADICDAVEVEDEGLPVIDVRDNKVYWIAKLRDGNCWMTQNLDLDLNASRTYTNLDTDIGYNTTTGEYDAASWTPMRSTYAPTSTQIHEWCVGGTWNNLSGGYCEENSTPESYDPGNLYWNAVGSDRSDWDAYYASCDFSTNTISCNQSLNPISTYTSSTGIAQHHLGNYYNWTATVASNDSSVYEAGDLVEQSICPAGWTLPRAGIGDGTFSALLIEYGWDSNNHMFDDISNLTGSPIYATAGGAFYGFSGFIGVGGLFWLSAVGPSASDGEIVIFSVDSGEAIPDIEPNGSGLSVRCLAR